ncbi:carbon storage regulator [Xanthomonas oryzae pv. oryzicola]|uniref:carbon storage regulator n=1 Tax=Xanthomonas oryzae TaxID=347 RepID=UPI000A700172|nr:carbon storage regulator [Xanthomonas oryzae]
MNRKALTLGAPAHAAGAAVLRMAEEETIHIGHAIEIHLVKAHDGRVVLSILAPRSLSIDRAKNFQPPPHVSSLSSPTPDTCAN